MFSIKVIIFLNWKFRISPVTNGNKSRNLPTSWGTAPPKEDIEALINVDRRTVIFEKLDTDEGGVSHPLHQISWYQNTSVEDIESAIDEVVEIMEEIKRKSVVD